MPLLDLTDVFHHPSTGMDICLLHTTVGPWEQGLRCLRLCPTQSRRMWLSNEGMSSLPENPQAVCLTLFDTQRRHGESEFTACAQACTQGQRQSWGSSAGKSAPPPASPFPPSHSSSCGFSLSQPPSQLPRGPAVCLGAVLLARQDPTPA